MTALDRIGAAVSAGDYVKAERLIRAYVQRTLARLTRSRKGSAA